LFFLGDGQLQRHAGGKAMADGEGIIRGEAPLSEFEAQLRVETVPVVVELVFLEDLPVVLADRVMRLRRVPIARVVAKRQAWYVQRDTLGALVNQHFDKAVDRMWADVKCYQCDLTPFHRFVHHTLPDHCAWGDSLKVTPIDVPANQCY
jgi:hypothetical protein